MSDQKNLTATPEVFSGQIFSDLTIGTVLEYQQLNNHHKKQRFAVLYHYENIEGRITRFLDLTSLETVLFSSDTKIRGEWSVIAEN